MFDVVVRDVTGRRPPYKPFYQWYLDDASMNLHSSLKKAAKNAENRLIWYAEKENLLCVLKCFQNDLLTDLRRYQDFHDHNIYFRKEALRHVKPGDERAVMPIDWGGHGSMDVYSGVVDVAHDGNKPARIQDFVDKMRNELPSYFNVERLYYELYRHGHELRVYVQTGHQTSSICDAYFAFRGDMDSTAEYDGKYYDLLLVQQHKDIGIDTYKVLPYFGDNTLLMDRVYITSEDSGRNIIDGYREVRVV